MDANHGMPGWPDDGSGRDRRVGQSIAGGIERRGGGAAQGETGRTGGSGASTGGSIEAEVASQPECWLRAAELAAEVAGLLPAPGERVAVAGCGTSWFMAQSYAAAREAAGHGETDAFAASEFPVGRRYDHVVALTRSGTTTEIHTLLAKLHGSVPTTAITGVPAEI